MAKSWSRWVTAIRVQKPGRFSTQKSPNRSDEAQIFNELKATGICVGLLSNFGPTKVEFKRLVF